MWRGAEIKGADDYLLAICVLTAETRGGEFLPDSRLWRYQEPEALRLCMPTFVLENIGDDSGAFGLDPANRRSPDSTMKRNR